MRTNKVALLKTRFTPAEKAYIKGLLLEVHALTLRMHVELRSMRAEGGQ